MIYRSSLFYFTQFTFLWIDLKKFKFHFFSLFLFLFLEFFLTRLPPSERDYPVDPCLQLRHDLKLNFSFGFFKPSFGSVTCTHIHLRQKRVRDGFFSFKKHNICKNTTSLLKVKPNFEGNSFVSQLWLTCVGNSCFVCRSKMFCTGDPQKAKRGEKANEALSHMEWSILKLGTLNQKRIKSCL